MTTLRRDRHMWLPHVRWSLALKGEVNYILSDVEWIRTPVEKGIIELSEIAEDLHR